MKYYCLITNSDGEIALFDDIRKDGSQNIKLSVSAIYPSKVDADKMKKLVERHLGKDDLVTIKECEVIVNEKD